MPLLRLRQWPSVVRALLALGLVFLGLMLLGRFGALHLPGWAWLLLLSVGAGGAGRWMGLGGGWLLFLLLLPWSVDGLLRLSVGRIWYGGGLLLLFLLFGGGLFTQVPLYLSGRPAWEALLELLPKKEAVRFLDLGCGLGGPLLHLARQRPDGVFRGVEASLFTWFLAWVRCGRHAGVQVALGSLWKEELGSYDMVYAFLSPTPMGELWEKARREMGPGSLFVSHTFEVPGQIPDLRIPLPGRKDACLLVWRM